jgi:hypothetical protein
MKLVYYLLRTKFVGAFDRIVRVVTGYGLDLGIGVRVPIGQEISPYRLYQLWDPPDFLSKAYRRRFPSG